MEIELDSRQIHLWCAFYAEIDAPPLLEEYRSLLSAAERRQEFRFHFARDQRRYLVTRALVRTALTRYTGIAPADWTFSTNNYGRPRIANAAAAHSKLSFNISHTHDLIVLAISHDRELGVDVENVRSQRAAVEVADRFFAPDEVSALRALPSARHQQRFFEYWTLKESYIKARGMGLSIPLDRFSFHFPADDDVEIAIHPDQADPPARWRFWQFELEPEYLAALCVERCVETPELVVRKVVPLVSEHELPYRVLRSSKLRASSAR